MNIREPGRAFEERALAVARAIHDPLGNQGSVIHNGQERDALFIDDRTVAAFEFTADRTKEKARKDASKLADLLRDLSSDPTHRHKALIGYFVTAHEPTADQRAIVDQVARSSRQQLRAMSLLSLQKQLIDAEAYIRNRLNAPFGSAHFSGASSHVEDGYIEPTFQVYGTQEQYSLDDVIERTVNGQRTVIAADYGTGKSEALRQSFIRLRKSFFRNTGTENMPVHINLNECRGLRTAREVLRRHAEEIGFANESSLIATWRSGNVTLLLDGFDELVPTRWVGGARDLKQVRKQALEPVRRLISETPSGSGIVIAGRPQYFGTTEELSEALGLETPLVLELQDFDAAQVEKFAGDVGIPDWMPTRPLMLRFYTSIAPDRPELAASPGPGWRELLSQVAAREADRIGSLTREIMKRLICRVATAARASGDALGPITIDEMRRAFADICGYDPEEEGLQLLLRLPGLISSTSADTEEVRRFIDVDFADAAYGEDLARYLAAPYDTHPLSSAITWNVASGELSSEVAADVLAHQGFEPGHLRFAIKKRMGDGHFDAVLLDAARTADRFNAPFERGDNILISEAIVSSLQVLGSADHVSNGQYNDCIIDYLDLTELEDAGTFPTFRSCLIGHIDGWREVPKRYAAHFIDCEVASFSGTFGTTDGLLTAGSTIDDSIALTILKKIYKQKGSGRKLSALSRGLPPHEKGRVGSVLSALESTDLVRRVPKGNIELFVPVPKYRQTVSRILEAPAGFSLTDL